MEKANPDWGLRIAEWRRWAGLLPGLVLLVPAYGLVWRGESLLVAPHIR